MYLWLLWQHFIKSLTDFGNSLKYLNSDKLCQQFICSGLTIKIKVFVLTIQPKTLIIINVSFTEVKEFIDMKGKVHFTLWNYLKL